MNLLHYAPEVGFGVYSRCEYCGVHALLDGGTSLASAAVIAHAEIRRHRMVTEDRGDAALFPCCKSRVAIVSKAHVDPPLWEAVLLPNGWAYCANGDRATRPRKGEAFEHPWTGLQERQIVAMDRHGRLPGRKVAP